jgi:hypothetical protein
MTIRGTTHYVEVIGEGSGNIRVTRQYVDLLTPVSSDILESVSSTLNLTDVASREISLNVTSTLNFVDFVGREISENVTNNLNFSQVAAKVSGVSANNALVLSDFADGLPIFTSIPLSNNLKFVKTVFVASFPIVIQTLNFTQNLSFVGPRPETIYQPVTFFHSARNSAHNLRVTQELELEDRARIPIPITVTQTINLTDEATITNPVHTLNFVQTVAYAKSIGVEVSHLTLTDNIVLNGDWVRTIVQDSGLGHAMTYFLDSPCANKSFHPFIGENTASSKAQSTELPDTQIEFADRKFLLYYPGTDERVSTVQLRTPELDNRDRLAFTRLNQETRGGYLIVYSDPNWPKITTLIFTFIALKKSEIDELQTFFENYLGLEVGITDWEGREWLGIITDPDQPASEDGRGQWTISFTFEGARLEEEPAQLALTDQLTFNMIRVRSLEDTLTFTQDLVHEVVTP